VTLKQLGPAVGESGKKNRIYGYKTTNVLNGKCVDNIYCVGGEKRAMISESPTLNENSASCVVFALLNIAWWRQ